MAGYLDQYGKADVGRERVYKGLLYFLIAAVAIGGPLTFIFHNFRQEHQLKKFFDLLAAKDYKPAYALWGCTDQKPCIGYSMQSFMEDWGPEKTKPSSYRIVKSRSCGSGVILTVDLDPSREEKLWVERESLVIGFSPLPGCPAPR